MGEVVGEEGMCGCGGCMGLVAIQYKRGYGTRQKAKAPITTVDER